MIKHIVHSVKSAVRGGNGMGWRGLVSHIVKGTLANCSTATTVADSPRGALRFIQANLQRSKLATAELHKMAQERGVSVALVQEPYVGRTGVMTQIPGTQVVQCTLGHQTPVKAAIVVYGDTLEVIHDPQLVTENIAAVCIKAGQLSFGILSVYFEGDADIEPYIVVTGRVISRLATTNIIVGGDVNAWSHWWGSSVENDRGAEYSLFLAAMEYEVLNVHR